MGLTITLLVLLALALGARFALPRLVSSVAGGPIEPAASDGDDARRLADCPGSPNCQGSDSSREEQRVAPFSTKGSTAETMAALETLIGSQERAELVRRDADYLHAVFTTPLMGFADDVEFLVDEASDTVRVRSASRLGHSDLGANAKRLARLREAWERL